MAQLTDDCFAFSGPLLPIADMERMIAERVQPVTETESVPLAAARGRVLARRRRSRRSICRRSTIPRSMATRCGTAISMPRPRRRLAIGGRLTAGSAARKAARRGRGDPHLHRRADAGRRRHRVHAGGCARRRRRGDRAGGTESRRQPQAGRRGRAQGLGRAAGRPAARRAGRGARRRGRPDRHSTVRRRVRVALFSTGDEIVEPGSPRPAAALYDANRTLLDGMLDRLGANGDRSRHHQGRSRRAGAGDRRRRARPRSGADLGRRLDRRGRSCAERRGKDRPAGVLARRHQAGPAGGDGRDPRRERRTAARRSSACPAIRSRRS